MTIVLIPQGDHGENVYEITDDAIEYIKKYLLKDDKTINSLPNLRENMDEKCVSTQLRRRRYRLSITTDRNNNAIISVTVNGRDEVSGLHRITIPQREWTNWNDGAQRLNYRKKVLEDLIPPLPQEVRRDAESYVQGLLNSSQLLGALPNIEANNPPQDFAETSINSRVYSLGVFRHGQGLQLRLKALVRGSALTGLPSIDISSNRIISRWNARDLAVRKNTIHSLIPKIKKKIN